MREWQDRFLVIEESPGTDKYICGICKIIGRLDWIDDHIALAHGLKFRGVLGAGELWLQKERVMRYAS